MIYKAPEEESAIETDPKVFLAGSIGMGKAEKWQDRIGKRFSDAGCAVFDPRRDDWNPDAEQSYDNDYFRKQVEWEIWNIKRADLVFFYIDPNTKSPITLFELGACATLDSVSPDKKKMVVVCPDGFYRYGNLEVYSKSFDMFTMFDNEDDAFDYIKNNYWLFRNMNF